MDRYIHLQFGKSSFFFIFSDFRFVDVAVPMSIKPIHVEVIEVIEVFRVRGCGCQGLPILTGP